VIVLARRSEIASVVTHRQHILDQIYELRESKANREWAEAQRAPKALPALVVLVDRLGDPTATGMIIRRPNENPTDVIMLAADKLSVPTYGAAIQALVRVRRETGDVPRQTLQVIVHGQAVPASWDQLGLREEALADLRDLRGAPKRDIKGVGSVRAISISVLGAKSQ
jgi:hypothetical protein